MKKKMGKKGAVCKNQNFTVRNCSLLLQLNWTERQKTAVDYGSKHLEQSGEDWWSFNAVNILLQFFHACAVCEKTFEKLNCSLYTHSASLPLNTHCSSFWNRETVQLCVTKAGRWSLQYVSRHSLRAVTVPDRVPFTQLTEHIEAKIHMARPLPGWSRLVALAPDDERDDHGRLQQPPTNVSPPPHRQLSNRVVRVVLVSQVDAPHAVVVCQNWFGYCHLLLAPWCLHFCFPPSLAEHLWKE